MRRKKILGCVLAGALSLGLVAPLTVYADGQKVVTLGADLSQDQKNAVLRYFGILGQNIPTLTITNQDERDHLGSYVPLEQIGTRTYSCALVSPTSSGGIQVKTANLSWVTSNMIATTLSTSGVVNCEVLAAAPFEVSGTGALTGIIMAYETASGQALDPVKKELATQELITTGTIANRVGQTQATNIVNEIKIQVIQQEVAEPEKVEEIVEEVIDDAQLEDPEVQLSDEDRALLTGLMTQIAEQNYDYEEVKDTLQRVEDNLADLNETVENAGQPTEEPEPAPQGEDEPEPESEPETEPETLAPDSILTNTDDTALGENVNIDATTPEAVQPQTEAQTETPSGQDFEITTSDSYGENEAEPQPSGTDQGVDLPEQEVPENGYVDPNAGQADPNYTDPNAGWADPGYTDPNAGLADPGYADPNAGLADPGLADPGYADPNAAGTDATYEDPNAETPEGLPQETEPQAPEVQALALTAAVRTPDSSMGETFPAGCGIVKLAYGNENLTMVSGNLTVTDAFGETIATLDLSDADQVKAVPASDETLMNNGWTAGTEFLMNIGTALQTYENYTLTVSATVTDATGATADIYETWPVNTDSYGVSVNISRLSDVTANAMFSGTLYLPDRTAEVSVSSTDENVLSVDISQYTSDNPVFTVICLQPGTAEVMAEFYDAEGNYVGFASTELTVF